MLRACCPENFLVDFRAESVNFCEKLPGAGVAQAGRAPYKRVARKPRGFRVLGYLFLDGCDHFGGFYGLGGVLGGFDGLVVTVGLFGHFVTDNDLCEGRSGPFGLAGRGDGSAYCVQDGGDQGHVEAGCSPYSLP